MSLDVDPDAVLWNADPSDRDGRPLLVLMHGRRSDEHDLFALGRELPSEYLIASIRAPIAEDPGFSWWETGVPGDPDAGLVDAAAAAVSTWLDALPFTPSKVGALGFSQGGAMATHLLRRDGTRIAFALNVAGIIVRGEQAGDAALAVSRPPVFWGRGAEDPLFTREIVARTEPWVVAHADATVRVYPGLGHAISQEELADIVAFLTAQLPGR